MVAKKLSVQPPVDDTISLEAELRLNLERLEFDGEEESRREAVRLLESRHSTAAMLRALLAIEQRLGRFEELFNTLQAAVATQPINKEWYTVREIAKMLGKAEFTVREWCRLGRVNAAKRDCGRGNSTEWIVSYEELLRIQNEGLLPD